jgi:hypothetical protein
MVGDFFARAAVFQADEGVVSRFCQPEGSALSVAVNAGPVDCDDAHVSLLVLLVVDSYLW